LLVSVILGIVSGYLPAYKASRMNIVEGLRHIG
jgi:ABC-type antimicrobial peptide transport system permease subunit